jgi:two-component system CheB/CheR fusion protein
VSRGDRLCVTRKHSKLISGTCERTQLKFRLFTRIFSSSTQFFRHPEAFEALKRHVLPQLLENRPAKEGLRLWVPGCATGEEPYSLAICVLECLEQVKGQVLP